MSEEQQKIIYPHEDRNSASLPKEQRDRELSHAMRQALFCLEDGLISQEPVVTWYRLRGRPAEFLSSSRVSIAQE